MQANPLFILLQENATDFSAVVPFSAGRDKLLALNFTAANTELTETVLQDTRLFTQWINQKLQAANARYGIGGYAEHRTVYSRSKLFDSSEITKTQNVKTNADEPRRLHLGIDIWGKPHTAVMAPCNGIVHSFAFNDSFGDYGTTIILTHQLKGVTFYTLYGHLSLNSIKNLREGELIKQGEIFAEFGLPHENGQWPPHLHFQIIADLQGWEGDYPGVCKFSEKEKWLSNCPDPDLILQMNKYL
ncbi:peptidoglycan DD-metalloendopeptidase family protein [Terrimonas pollutisoli]|uniref:peptidoglycan DD-metalloendopeptidase family protein n=1 Tax=Terrimonas pollutisoli TaxID=3034147 RepID=UPI0023EB8445|nr:peptidoglycan DD-metalloendopeptidase family protein [Terrimonas sp. H1YJ31]